MRPKRLSYQALRVCCGAGKILASFRRFWAVAARRNSSFAPHGPRNRRRPRPRMRLRWANSISTFLRSFIEMSYWRVLAMSRATWRASSCSSRVILRASALGQLFGFRWVGLTDVLQCAVAGCALAGRPPVRVRVIPAELLQPMALGADILVVLGIPFELCPRPGAVAAFGLVYNRDVRRDLAIDQPAQHRSGAVSRIRDQAFGMQTEPGLHPIQHGLGRSGNCRNS